jgi:hypothetical protein
MIILHVPQKWDVDWIRLPQDRIQWEAVVNMAVQSGLVRLGQETFD